MKNVLFLLNEYPPFRSANDICSNNIIKSMLSSGKYRVTCICNISEKELAHEDNLRVYPIKIKDVAISNPNKFLISFRRFIIHIGIFLSLPFYPLDYEAFGAFRIFKFCKRFLKDEKFDIVISQHHPLSCTLAGLLLKKKGIVPRYGVIFWDPLYGKTLIRLINKKFAYRRQRKLESLISKYADILFSLEAMEGFHNIYGDIDEAKDKRFYLGIPQVIKPSEPGITVYDNVIKNGYINIIYSGLINLSTRDPLYFLRLLNSTKIANRINVVFFSRGDGTIAVREFKNQFKGIVQVYDYISIDDLHSLFHKVDFLVSLSGKNPYMVPSKVLDYISYGKPIISFTSFKTDAASKALTNYPCKCIIDMNDSLEDNINTVESFINLNTNVSIEFMDIQQKYPKYSPSAYIDIIERIV